MPMLKQIGTGLLRLALAVVVGTVVGAVLFSGIDWMRTFQSDSIASAVSRAAIVSDDFSNLQEPPIFRAIAMFIDWYSTVFFGYSRFGAGLFMIAASLWAVSQAKSYSIVAKVVVAFVAGVLIGLRSAMFVMSRPALVLVIAVLSGFLYVAIVLFTSRPPRFKPLPKLQFKAQN